MINEHKTNGEAICFICNKSEVDDKDILLGNYLDIIKRKFHLSKNPKISTIPLKNILNPKDLNQICKCENLHITNALFNLCFPSLKQNALTVVKCSLLISQN